MRLIDRFVSEWAAPSLTTAQFRRAHRKFTLAGSVQIQVDFRLHPLNFPGETFWVEWWPRSDVGPSYLPIRIDTPPVMSIDPASRAMWPPEYFKLQLDLWRITEETAPTYGAILRDLLEETYIPVWHRLREQTSTRLSPDDNDLVGRVTRVAFNAQFERVGERVARGELDRLEPELTRLEQAYPHNAWVRWWRSVQTGPTPA